MGAIGKEKYLWISNVLPMSIVDRLGLSVAGKKMELSLLRGFEGLIDCDVLSVSAQGRAESEALGFDLWENKKYAHIPAICGFSPSSGKKFKKKILRFLTEWCEKNAEAKKSVIVVNSPLHICRPLVKLQKKYSLKLFSITVDFPRLEKSKNIKQAVLNFYRKCVFQAGHRTLRAFNGLIGVNANVKRALGLSIPFHKMLIGIDALPEEAATSSSAILPYKVAFAGTLIDYNGIEPLMDAITSLDTKLFELHIYGYGPLQSKVEDYCRVHENICFHGQVPNSEILNVLSTMDILVNPRVVSIDISDYTFPSKIVEYISTGKPVVTTRFSAMPPEYEDFVFAIDQATEKALAEKLTEITELPTEELARRSRAGRTFVEKQHSYSNICAGIIEFVKNTA